MRRRAQWVHCSTARLPPSDQAALKRLRPTSRDHQSECLALQTGVAVAVLWCDMVDAGLGPRDIQKLRAAHLDPMGSIGEQCLPSG